MVYCTKCGFKNLDDARFCVKCGANLEVLREEGWERRLDEWGEEFGRRVENECFGLSGLGPILGIIIGIFIIIAGISILVGETIWRWIGPSFIIVIGLLIIASVLSRMWRK